MMHDVTTLAWVSAMSFMAGMLSLLFSVFFISRIDSEAESK